MAFTYKSGFKSHKGTVWDKLITDTWVDTIPVAEPDDEFVTRAIGFKLRYTGKDTDPLDPIKSTSCRLEWICKTQTQETEIDDIFDVDFNDNVYVIIFKDSVLYWWGYLQPNVSQKANKWYSLTYTLEAQCSLSMLKTQKIYDNIYAGTVHINGFDVGIPKFRFGAPRVTTLVSTTSWPKHRPTVVEAVYSLIYDLDWDVGGTLKVVGIWKDLGSTKSSATPLGRTTLNIWHYLFNDVPPQNAFGLPVDRRQQTTAYEIMKTICELFCCRVFQRNGEFYLTQVEFYETGGNTLQDVYIKNPVSLGQHPVYDASQSGLITTADYLTAITSPPVTPFFVGESSFSKLYSLFAVTLNGSAAAGKLDWSVKQKISAVTNNLAALSTRDKEVVTEFPLAGIRYINAVNPQLPQTGQVWQRVTGGSFFDTYITAVNSMLEHRNGYRKKFQVTIKDVDYDFFRGITYAGVGYIPHAVSFNANLERWEGTWIEQRVDATGLDEAIGFAPSNGDYDTYINNLILEWIKKRTG